MRIEDMQSFLEVVECGSLTHAANKLYITQPALSHRIKELERQLNTSLIIRRRGVSTVELTPAGKAFIPQAEKWIKLQNETENVLKIASRQTLGISASVSIGSCLLHDFFPRLLQSLSEKCMLFLRMSSSMGIYDRMESGETDIGLVGATRYSSKVETAPIATEEFVLIAHKGTYENGSEPIFPSDLDPGKEVLVQWSTQTQLWHEHWFGTAARPILVSEGILSIPLLREIPGSWGIMPWSIARRHGEGLDIFPLSDAPEPRSIYFANVNGNDELKKIIVLVRTEICRFLSCKEHIHVIDPIV